MLIKKFFVFCLLMEFNVLFSQEYIEVVSLSGKEYHGYATQLSVPTYNLKKVRSMISKLNSKYMGDGGENLQENDLVDYYSALSEKDFKKLSSKEKFTYTMIHPELVSKNYAEENMIEDEDKIIPGYLAFTLDGATWSERQVSFLKSERKEVIKWIKEYSLKEGHIGINYKKALEEINAIESIPFLIDFYQNIDKKDPYILTLLLILIKKSGYYPFVRSNIYRDLYQNENSVNTSYIQHTSLVEEYVIKTAENVYKVSGKR